MKKYDKQIDACGRKFNHIRDMFNNWRSITNTKGNQIGWMYNVETPEQKMCYDYNWAYWDLDRRMAYCANWMRGQISRDPYPYIRTEGDDCVYYFGYDAALAVRDLFQYALDMYIDYGGDYDSDAERAYNVNWLLKNIRRLKRAMCNSVS